MENKLPVLNFTNGSQKRSKTIKRKLKEEFCNVRKQFDRLNQKYKRKYVYQEQQKLEDQLNACSQSEFCILIGKTGIANERKPRVPWAIIDDTGNVKTDKNSVLNKWKDEFQALFTNNSENNNNLNETDFDSNINVDSLNGVITRDEILLAVTQAKNRKAAGIDDIPAEVLKNEVAIELLYQIISGCFELGRVPSQWTSGVINPILKQGSSDNRCPLNYRGGSLTKEAPLESAYFTLEFIEITMY
ncbi:unnamed protein product [Mytilus coruscus]|uniref:Reverse transcriptase domain-containing protein n=1 Tax=Mytilus coruscus TaxID=42192 RepID=A0A6J8BG50_MYTCO|nr:unnamed protein product [Mytilus coruscus]